MNAVPQIERCAVRQLNDFQILSHPPLAWLWWVEVGARPDPGYTLLPLMTVKAG